MHPPQFSSNHLGQGAAQPWYQQHGRMGLGRYPGQSNRGKAAEDPAKALLRDWQPPTLNPRSARASKPHTPKHSGTPLTKVGKSPPNQSPEGLLEPSTAAMLLMLQQPIDFDPCSLACLAVTCSTLSHAVLARYSKWSVRCSEPRAQERLNWFNSWFGRHTNSLSNLVQCSIVGDCNSWPLPHLRTLPCPGLTQLDLKRLRVQLGHADGSPGVLHGCPSLTALHFDSCRITHDAVAAAAAITALTALQSLSMSDTRSSQQRVRLFESLAFPTQLTYLSLIAELTAAEEAASLNQLSDLVSLEHLELAPVRPDDSKLPLWVANPWLGLPSQLSKLSCLRLGFTSTNNTGLNAQQLQQLSSLTALRQLAIKGQVLSSVYISAMQHLVQLTALEFECNQMHVGYTHTTEWTRLTNLESFSMKGGSMRLWPLVERMATQLRALRLERVRFLESAVIENFEGKQLEELLLIVPRLSVLTELSLTIWSDNLGTQPSPPLDTFTSLVTSTNLCSLRLGLEAAANTPDQWVLFAPDVAYPHLRVINLAQLPDAQDVPIGEQQLQQMCSCCPAVQELGFALCVDASLTALQPLLQLSALTQLIVHRVGTAAAGVFGVAGQLTGLRRLELMDIPRVTDPAVSQLTALTKLKDLWLWQEDMEECWEFVHEACWCKHTAVWLQLLRRLLRDAAGRSTNLRKRKR